MQQDDALVEALLELSQNAIWRADCGFKNGYLLQLEAMMEAKLPGCGIKSSPHIESRAKWFKQKYSAMTDMLALSGFGWDNDKMVLQCEKNVYDEYVKVCVLNFFSWYLLLSYFLFCLLTNLIKTFYRSERMLLVYMENLFLITIYWVKFMDVIEPPASMLEMQMMMRKRYANKTP